MANYTNVMGFYVPIGSKDYPKSWSPMDKFGFDSTDIDAESVYSKSMNDVINLFRRPITSVSKFSITNEIVENWISQLIFETPVEGFNTSIISEQNINNRWITVMLILDYLFINQDKNTLHSDFHENLSDIIKNRTSHYVTSSLTIDKGIHNHRINFVTFKLNHGDGENNNVTYKIYFNPDSLIVNEGNDRIDVFLYEDASDPVDDYIDVDEWEERIIQKHVDIFEDARYKIWSRFTTPYYENVEAGAIPHHFFIYSLTEISLPLRRNAVRNFLLNTVRPNMGRKYTFEECVLHYPELFSSESVLIFPLDVKQKTPHQNEYSSLINYKKIVDTLDFNNIERNDNNFQNSELFFIGSENENIFYNIPFAAIAVNMDRNDTTKPISKKFRQYAPIYTPINYEEAPDYRKFHKLVRLAISIVYGVTPTNDQEVVDMKGINNTFEINGEGNSITVSFIMLSTMFIVKKPLAVGD